MCDTYSIFIVVCIWYPFLIDALDQLNVSLAENDILTGQWVFDRAPEVRILHALQEIVQLIALRWLDDFLGIPIVANVLVFVVPLHRNIADCIADVLFVRCVVISIFIFLLTLTLALLLIRLVQFVLESGYCVRLPISGRFDTLDFFGRLARCSINAVCGRRS